MNGQDVVDRWRDRALHMGWITGDAPPGAFIVLAEMIDEALLDAARPILEAIAQESTPARGR